jgi:hypothetical protein
MDSVAGTEGATHELIPLSDHERWEAALRGIDHAFWHRWACCSALAAPSVHSVHLYAYTDAKARVVCPLIERQHRGHTDVATPAGFSGFAGRGRSRDFPGRWTEFARRQGWVCGYIAVHPLLEWRGLIVEEEVRFERNIYVLPLNGDEEALFGRLSTNRKRQIRAWRGARKDTTRDAHAISEFLVEAAPDFYRARHASAAYYVAPEGWRALLRLPEILAIGAVSGGRIVAVSVFALAGRRAEYLFNISVPEGQYASAPLLWEGALALRARGASLLNLGGGLREGDSLAEFKRRFGSEMHPVPCVKQIYDPERYARLCREAHPTGVPERSFFPAYHNRPDPDV